MPSLIRPVLISGPFYHAVTQQTTSNREEGAGQVNGTNRIEGDCDGTSSVVSYTTNLRVSSRVPDHEDGFKRYQQSFCECYR